MGIERNFPDFGKEIKKETSHASDEKSGDAFYAALEFVNEYFSDPHLNFDINELTDEDLKLAQKFQNDELTEEEVNERLKHAHGGSPSSNFCASLMNKLVAKEGMRKRMERKEQENRNHDTV